MSYSGNPIQATASIQVSIGTVITDYELTIGGNTFTWPISDSYFDPLGAFDLDVPAYGDNRGVPRSNKRVTLSGKHMRRRTADRIKFAITSALPLVEATITDEAGMEWEILIVDARFTHDDGTDFMDYRITMLLQSLPSTIRTICS